MMSVIAECFLFLFGVLAIAILLMVAGSVALMSYDEHLERREKWRNERRARDGGK